MLNTGNLLAKQWETGNSILHFQIFKLIGLKNLMNFNRTIIKILAKVDMYGYKGIHCM